MEKSNVKKFFALGLVFCFGFWLVYLFYKTNFLTPILSAIILSFLLYPIYHYFQRKTKRDILCALIVIFSLLLIFIFLVSSLGGVLYSQIKNFDLGGDSFKVYEERIFELSGIEINIAESVSQIESLVKVEGSKYIPKVLSVTSSVMLYLFIMFFMMFYFFVEKDFFVREFVNLMPFSKKGSLYLLDESSKRIKAIFIGQLLTAIIQGILGMISFLIAGVNGAIFWGIVMIILSIIPVVGAFLVWLPAGLFLMLEGSVGMGIFVLLWGFLVVSNVDNLVRPKLVNKFADIHPLETFLGVFIGIAFFGLLGIVIGPLLISIFVLLLRVFRKEYSLKSFD